MGDEPKSLNCKTLTGAVVTEVPLPAPSSSARRLRRSSLSMKSMIDDAADRGAEILADDFFDRIDVGFDDRVFQGEVLADVLAVLMRWRPKRFV